MGKVFIEKETLTGIADAVRGKNGTTEPIPTTELATAITNLPTGGNNELFALLVQDKLTDITAQDSEGITTISSNAFTAKSALITAVFPDAVSVGWQAFTVCSGLTTFIAPKLTTIGGQAFSRTGITELDLPNVTTIQTLAFNNCASLKKVSLGKSNIGNDIFANCSALETLILRKTTGVQSLPKVAALSTTPIAEGTGYIYVPSSLLEEYKVATNWATYAEQFRAIEDYPEICGDAE